MLKTLLLLCLCLASTFAVPPTSSIFMGRSADIIIESETLQDSVILFKGEQFSTTQLKNMEDTRFADLFAHVMGTQPFHVDADRSGFPSSSLFSKPRAALLVAIDSVGSGILNKFPTLSLLQNAHTSTIITHATPANTHTIIANLATGSTPSQHGIVGSSWKRPSGARVEAYSSEGPSFSSNIADILFQETSAKGLVVSASSSPSFASSLGVHPQLVQKNAHTYSLKNGAFVSNYESGSSLLELSEETISLLSDAGVSGVVFSIKTPEDLALLAEFAFVNNLISKLNSDLSASVKDNMPDMYSFVFASLKGIQAKYGEESAEFAAALTLVDKAISALTSALNLHYDNRVATAVLALNARDLSSTSLKQRVFTKVSPLLHSEEDFESFYPALFVRTGEFSGYARDIMCSNLQKAVGEDGASVFCGAPIIPTRSVRAVGADGNTTPPICPGYNATQVALDYHTVWAFWLNFFITIIIACFVGWGVYCLAFVGSDASKDSLLFRATGRHHHQN